MERYLLFDSGCGRCSALASDVARVADGKLEARSLREPGMQAFLEEARPNWRWEPTLLEVRDGMARAYTRSAMARRLVTTLGPRRGFQIARIVASSPASISQDRRKMLRMAGGLSLLSLVAPPAIAALLPKTASAAGPGEGGKTAPRDLDHEEAATVSRLLAGSTRFSKLHAMVRNEGRDAELPERHPERHEGSDGRAAFGAMGKSSVSLLGETGGHRFATATLIGRSARQRDGEAVVLTALVDVTSAKIRSILRLDLHAAVDETPRGVARDTHGKVYTFQGDPHDVRRYVGNKHTPSRRLVNRALSDVLRAFEPEEIFTPIELVAIEYEGLADWAYYIPSDPGLPPDPTDPGVQPLCVNPLVCSLGTAEVCWVGCTIFGPFGALCKLACTVVTSVECFAASC